MIALVLPSVDNFFIAAPVSFRVVRDEQPLNISLATVKEERLKLERSNDVRLEQLRNMLLILVTAVVLKLETSSEVREEQL